MQDQLNEQAELLSQLTGLLQAHFREEHKYLIDAGHATAGRLSIIEHAAAKTRDELVSARSLLTTARQQVVDLRSRVRKLEATNLSTFIVPRETYGRPT
jgi:phage I-like protein